MIAIGTETVAESEEWEETGGVIVTAIASMTATEIHAIVIGIVATAIETHGAIGRHRTALTGEVMIGEAMGEIVIKTTVAAMVVIAATVVVADMEDSVSRSLFVPFFVRSLSDSMPLPPPHHSKVLAKPTTRGVHSMCVCVNE